MTIAKIGVMGARGSFSEQAGKTFVAQENGKYKDAEISYLLSADTVLASLERGEIDIGVVAFENLNGGFVIETLDALCAYSSRRVAIVEVNVHHQLLVKPGVERRNVKRIVSHPQALIQCRQYLKRKWPDVPQDEYVDTAQAAADLAEGNLDDSTAVIASLAAGNIHCLSILDRDIEDLKFNVTNFLVAERR